MEIRVKCECGEEECSEWTILELQGVVETQSSFQGSVQNLEIGRLCHSGSSQETYTFTVGYHELTGSKVTLNKPLLVLKKLQKCTDGSSEKETELEVVGIIRSKILFKTRPKPLFSGTS
ncbi:hypothetical protein Bca52824_035574 [Brassica carinata]|uniref:Chromosome transmission fidelity protein 8 n=1 Tax=Brassica carinata TaxID=52824 RepID=A0A8X7V1W9_BRACI|nr:hypothetical protein Bca52824_035574 [Brassica carinata]